MSPSSLPESTVASPAGLQPRTLFRLAGRFGTPYYLYDFHRLEEDVRRFRQALPQRFEIFYAVKANPSLAILSLFGCLGLGTDVASAGELEAALAAGIPPERILMTGPAKSDGDLAAAVRSSILGINVEGRREVERLHSLAEERDREIRVQLRLRLDGMDPERIPIIGGPRAGKFGFDLPGAEEILVRHSQWPRLRFAGIQTFGATNVLSAHRLVAQARRTITLALDLARRHHFPLEILDFGGGFGVPYLPRERPLRLDLLRRRLERIAHEADGDPLLRDTRFIFEPGRILVAAAGIYVVRILEVKEAADRIYALVDGGIHHLARPALVGTPQPAQLLPWIDGKRPRCRVTLAGPLCTSLDVLADSVLLPRPEPGDLVVFQNAGAYGYTESLPLFLSHPWPPELGIRGEEVAVLRPRMEPHQILSSQRVPTGLLPPADPATRAVPSLACGAKE